MEVGVIIQDNRRECGQLESGNSLGTIHGKSGDSSGLCGFILIRAGSGQFLTEVTAVPQGTMTLITPISKIKAIEQALMGRLMLVFAVGGVIMVILSLFITKRLIKPLMLLREELKKVKSVSSPKFSGCRQAEIGVVAESVYEMAGELERYNHVQKQFFQNASHELKSPLMSISGYAEGIRDRVFEGRRSAKGWISL